MTRPQGPLTRSRVRDHDAPPRPADDGVIPAAIANIDVVIQRSAITPGPYDRSTGDVDDRVGSRPTVQRVAATTSQQHVVARTAVEEVISPPADEDVVAAEADERIALRTARQRVSTMRPAPSHQQPRLGLAEETVRPHGGAILHFLRCSSAIEDRNTVAADFPPTACRTQRRSGSTSCSRTPRRTFRCCGESGIRPPGTQCPSA